LVATVELANVPPHITVPALLVCRRPAIPIWVEAPKMFDENVARNCAVFAALDAPLAVVAVFAPIVTMWFDAISPRSEVALVAKDVLPIDPRENHEGVELPVADRNFFTM
jgi:hypothetical protein